MFYWKSQIQLIFVHTTKISGGRNRWWRNASSNGSKQLKVDSRGWTSVILLRCTMNSSIVTGMNMSYRLSVLPLTFYSLQLMQPSWCYLNKKNMENVTLVKENNWKSQLSQGLISIVLQLISTRLYSGWYKFHPVTM